MGIISYPLILYGTRSVSISPRPITTKAIKHCNCVASIRWSKKTGRSSSKLYQYSWSKMSSSLKQRNTSIVTCINAKNPSGAQDENNLALQTVLNLYNAIRNQNIRELSDLIGDECRCVCNFFAFFQRFQGKQQVVDFFIHLIKIFGNNVEFVVTPTLHDGLNIGVAWKLEWSTTHVPLGKGLGFYTCQKYQGRVMIRNVEMFLEPVLHIEPLRLKLMPCAMAIIDKITYFRSSVDKVKRVMAFVFLVAVVAFFLKPGVH